MQITLSHYAGFCEGVARAYDIVKKIAKDPKTKWPVFVLGSLVHNEDVVKRIEKMGVKKIKVDANLGNFLENSAKEIGTLIITAHGIGPEIYELAKRNNINIVDTTCPKVISVQRLAKSFSERKYQLIIIGEKDHKEVRSIFEWAGKKANIIENENDLQKLLLDPKQKVAVVSQTTQDREFITKSALYLKEKYPQAEIIDSICATTHERQMEIKKLAAKNDVIVVIGSPESANSKRLWEVARRVNPKTFFIQRASELEKKWFLGLQKAAITAGASTPSWIIDEAVEYIKKI